MQFGYDENNLRTKPIYSGQKAICPFCGDILIGKCGDIYVKHWQHSNEKICDSWKEHETYWHRNWKSKFPIDWQEVIIEKGGVKHIADIKTLNEFVIEFQNSSISESTIKLREKFYEKMIWVINAKSFQNNFKRRSVVITKLQKLEIKSKDELSNIECDYKEMLSNISEKIKKNTYLTSEALLNINHKTEIKDDINKIIDEFDEYSKTVLDMWSNGDSYWNSISYSVTHNIEVEFKNNLKNITDKIIELENKINSSLHILKLIESHEDILIDGITFKIVPYKEINSVFYNKTRAISKSSRKTIFPLITNFKTDTEFLSFKYKTELFDFAIDPTDKIQTLNNEINENKLAIVNLEVSLVSFKEEIKSKLLQELKTKFNEIENDIKQLNNEHNILINKGSFLLDQQSRVQDEKESEIKESIIQIDINKREQRFKIMKENKGLYSFDWKHERKSWKVANCNIFFDIGEEYLLEKIKDGYFKKITIIDFLSRYTNKL